MFLMFYFSTEMDVKRTMNSLSLNHCLTRRILEQKVYLAFQLKTI